MRGFVGLLFGCVLGVSGCAGSATLVARTRDGGVIGLDGDRSEAMADARRQMSESCDGAYTIVGEEVAGTLGVHIDHDREVRFVCGAMFGEARPTRPAVP